MIYIATKVVQCMYICSKISGKTLELYFMLRTQKWMYKHMSAFSRAQREGTWIIILPLT